MKISLTLVCAEMEIGPHLWFSGHAGSPLSSCFSAGWIVKPLLSKAAIRFRLICSLVIDGVSLANTGLIIGLSSFVDIVVLLFSGFGVMPGAQARLQISPIRKVNQPFEIK